jgi:hypothetical protein
MADALHPLQQIQGVVLNVLEEINTLNVFDQSLMLKLETFKDFEFLFLGQEDSITSNHIIKFFDEFISQVEFFTEASSDITNFKSCDLIAISRQHNINLLRLKMKNNSSEKDKLKNKDLDNTTIQKNDNVPEYSLFPVKNISKIINKPHEKIINMTQNKSSLIILLIDNLTKEYLFKILKITPFQNEIELKTQKIGNLNLDLSQIYVTNNNLFLLDKENKLLYSFNLSGKNSKCKTIELDEMVKKVVTGSKHLMILTKSKELFGLGQNIELQLGSEETEEDKFANLIKLEAFDFDVIENIFAEGEFSMVVNNQKELQIVGRVDSRLRFSFPTQIGLPELLSNEELLSLRTSSQHLRFLTNKGRIFEWNFEGHKRFVLKENADKLLSEFSDILSNNLTNSEDVSPKISEELKRSILNESVITANKTNLKEPKENDFECKVIEEIFVKTNKKLQLMTQLQKSNKILKNPLINFNKTSHTNFSKNNLKIKTSNAFRKKKQASGRIIKKEGSSKPVSIKKITKKNSLSKINLQSIEKSKKNIIKIKRKNMSTIKKPKSTKRTLYKSSNKNSKKSIMKKKSSKNEKISKDNILFNLENNLPFSKRTGSRKLKQYNLLKQPLNPLVLKNNKRKMIQLQKKQRKNSNVMKNLVKDEKVSFLGFMKTLLSDKKKHKKIVGTDEKKKIKKKGFTNEKIKNVLKIID